MKINRFLMSLCNIFVKIGTNLNPLPIKSRFKFNSSYIKNDCKAIEYDWRMVGEDLNQVFYRNKK